jgi:hypothetical protein
MKERYKYPVFVCVALFFWFVCLLFIALEEAALVPPL